MANGQLARTQIILDKWLLAVGIPPIWLVGDFFGQFKMAVLNYRSILKLSKEKAIYSKYGAKVQGHAGIRSKVPKKG